MRILGMDIRRAAKPEARATATSSMSAADFYAAIGMPFAGGASDVPVTIETALGVPAIFGAVNFIAGTLAGLPLHLYEKKRNSREKVTSSGLAKVLHDAPNDDQSSFEWRKHLFEQVLTGGRGLSFIERNPAGQVVNIWPLDPAKTTIKREAGRKVYEYRPASQKLLTYSASEVIDIPFMLKADGLSSRSPIMTNRDVVALAIAVTQYGARFFNNGGVPPFAITGGFQSGRSMDRAGEDLQEAVRRAAKEQRQALVLPTGLEIKSIGADAEKSQLNETKQLMVQEIARIYALPPTFLQDLSNGTFSNTEQQDLHFVKHTLKRWVEAFEQELNLKLFGRQNKKFFVEMSMDGLLRGDFKGRMEGYATAIQNGILMPNEARQMENRPDDAAGDQLFMQGAMMPISSAGQTPADGGAAAQDATDQQGDADGA